MNIAYRFKDLSLKWKSFIIFTLVLTLPTSIFGSYVLYQSNHILRSQAVESAAKVLDSISQNVASMADHVQSISSYMIYDIQFRSYFTYDDDAARQEDYLRLQDSIHAFSAFQMTSKGYIHSIQLEGSRGNAPLLIGEQVQGDESDWVRSAMQAQGNFVWSMPYAVTNLWTGDQQYVISLFRQIKDINEINETIGFVRIRLNEQALLELIHSKGFAQTAGSVFMVDDKGHMMLHQDHARIGDVVAEPQLLKDMSRGTQLISYANEADGSVIIARSIPHTSWYVVARIDEAEIISHLDSIRTAMKGMIIFSVMMGIVAFAGFYWFIMRPIIALTESTIRVEQGNFDTQAPVLSHDEIGRLSLRFNKMVRTIQRLIDTKYKLELQHKEAEFKALQNQIDPHFLYNTLDTIHWTARIENAFETSTLIVALSKFFRISLSQGKTYIPLRQELDYARNYLILQKSRVRFNLLYEITDDESLQDVLVPKKLIQPLVENSIIHGFPDWTGTGFIRIRCSSERMCLHIDVEDTGRGFRPEQMQHYAAGSSDGGFALCNIQGRLSLLFGEGCGLSFHSIPGESNCVRITMPLLRSEAAIQSYTGRLGVPDESQSADRG
ncbi:sensor histidine kinase [Paenibacillus chartarius]|uniref:Sensor histidine kinase n=1 Tax=Paenibacillus chartarius TaxID=747481 RepID=A0ABV6DRU0_9BACL